ncbi:MAG TPA: HupE/UreJ family protein [Mariprofundaceae bacterium]|nr:HupE/UreJ family protein [Mariprofundaceae bacterium]
MARGTHDREGAGLLTLSVLLGGMAFPGDASAHIIDVHGMGFAGGFMHPLGGHDHLLAMLAVGFWSARLGGSALWMLPTVFLASAAMACLLAVGGGGLVPVMEGGIAASLVALGMLITLEARPGLAPAASLVAVFGLFHGYAHGAEMPFAASPLDYAAGFLLATAMLHVIGVALGAMTLGQASRIVPRLAGLAVALPGLVLLFSG